MPTLMPMTPKAKDMTRDARRVVRTAALGMAGSETGKAGAEAGRRLGTRSQKGERARATGLFIAMEQTTDGANRRAGGGSKKRK